MKKKQRYWLYGVLVFFIFHIARDILQDNGIHTLISDSFVKQDRSQVPFWYWQVLNTYFIAAIELFLAGICLRRGRFGRLGYATFAIALGFFMVWLIYWFLM